MTDMHAKRNPRRPRRRGFPFLGSLVVALVALAAGLVIGRGTGVEQEPPDATAGAAASGSPEPTPTQQECVVNELLVNSCRAWFGGTSNHYPEAEKWNKLDQLLAFEQRLGRRLDVAHNYHVAGDNELNEADVHFATRPNTLLLTSWKPADDWASAGGGDQAVNAGIDRMAMSIRKVRAKVFLAVFHEPENDVSAAPMCGGEVRITGSSGTAEEYRAMWRNVRQRFDALGVDNVVWVMNYMGYPPYNCMVDALYPGDDLVDWVLFNGYDQGDQDVDFVGEVRPFYEYLTMRSRPGHDYLAKPWGLAEWGIYDSSQQSAYRYYKQAREAVEGNVFPQLKMYLVFDSIDPSTGNGSYRVAYGVDGRRDRREQQAFNGFANTSALTGRWRLAE